MRVLLVVHGFPPRAIGGTELYAEAHARTLAEVHGDTVLVVAREDDRTRAELSVRDEARDGFRIAWVNHTFRDSTSVEDAWRAPRVAATVASVVAAFDPAVAHIHHLTCLSTLIPSLLSARGVPVTMTLHDYWLMCHRGQLVDRAGARCDGPGETGCAGCLHPSAAVATGAAGAAGARVLRAVREAAPALEPLVRGAARATASVVSGEEGTRIVSLARTRHVREDVLPHVDMFFAPCAHLRNRFIRFGIPEDRIRVAPYGIAPLETIPARRSEIGPLRVGFFGSLMATKAPHVAMQAVASLPAGTAHLDVFGTFVPYHGDDSYGAVLERAGAHEAVTLHGPLAHADVPSALAELDVLVVPSTWEENSPFVIHEAFRAGTPVVASRIGGIPELVEDDVNGLLVEPGDPAACAAAFARLAADRALLGRLRERLPPVRPLADAVAEIRTAGVRLLASRGRALPSGCVTAVVLHYHTPEETVLAVRALRASDAPLTRVIVVDNDETPALLDLGSIGLPVEHIRTGRNLGFPAGMNVGIRAALADGASAVLLVNSDVIVPADMTGALRLALDTRGEKGIAGPVVLARHDPGTIASMGIRFDRRSGRMRNLAVGEPFDEATHSGWRRADAVNGAVMLVDRAVFDAIGLLDEEYFFSFEEIDFCLRAVDAGFAVGVTGDAVAYHLGGGTLEPGSAQRFYFGARNHLRLASRVGVQSGVARLARTCTVVALSAAHALTAPGGHRLTRLAAVARGVGDYSRGVFGPGAA